MPICPPRSEKERESDRWEYVAGKALKEWVTRVTRQTKKNRREARAAILDKIENANLD